MPEKNVITTVSIEKAAAMLNKSAHSVRQLILRQKLGSEKKAGRVSVLLDDVLNYYAKKRNIPSMEKNINQIKHKEFVSLDFAAAALMVQPSYVISRIQRKLLEGYVTSSGDIMVAKDSINTYLSAIDHDKHTI
jgi:hypothetical protein